VKKRGLFLAKKSRYRRWKFAIKYLAYNMLGNFSAATECAGFENGWHSVRDLKILILFN